MSKISVVPEFDNKYIIRFLLFKYADIFTRLSVFDSPKGSPNTKRLIKISAGISKEGT